MKLNIYNVCLQTFIFISFSTTSQSIDSNTTKTIQIYSNNQTMNISKNTMIFENQVNLKYQNIELYAEKILIFCTQNKHNLSMLEAYGKPVVLHHIKNKIYAQALKIQYNALNDTVTLIDNACIMQSENSIRGDYITYSINKNKITAHSINKKNKVITTITQ